MRNSETASCKLYCTVQDHDPIDLGLKCTMEGSSSGQLGHQNVQVVVSGRGGPTVGDLAMIRGSSVHATVLRQLDPTQTISNLLAARQSSSKNSVVNVSLVGHEYSSGR